MFKLAPNLLGPLQLCISVKSSQGRYESKHLPASKHFTEILCTLYESALEQIYYHISFTEKLNG